MELVEVDIDCRPVDPVERRSFAGSLVVVAQSRFAIELGRFEIAAKRRVFDRLAVVVAVDSRPVVERTVVDIVAVVELC